MVPGLATLPRHPRSSPATPFRLNSSSHVRLSFANPLDDAQWDSQVASYPTATFFHSAAWFRVLRAAYHYTPDCARAESDGEPPALLPVMDVDSWLTGRRGVSLPFTDEFGPLCSNDDLASTLLGEMVSQAASRRWKYYELRGGRPMLNDIPASVSFYGHHLALEADASKLFARCQGAARTAVRKAEQAGLVVEFSRSMEAMRAFHTLLCKTRSRHGAPAQPLSFFQHIQREIMEAGRGWIVLAKQASKAVGGAVFFHFNRLALYKFAASDPVFRNLQANNLVLWRAIEHYAREGFASFDFGRTSLSNSGLRRFKLAWGTQERMINYARYDTASASFVRSVDRAAGWQTHLFKLLPPVVARSVGAMIYRHFA